MSARKRKTLPDDIGDVLRSGDIEAMKAAFARCEVNAGFGRDQIPALTALGMPEDFARWLVTEGGWDVDAADRQGRTALMIEASAWQGRIDLPLRLGADVNARDRWGETPLHHAVPRADVVAILLSHGADPRIADQDGRTPLLSGLITGSNADLEDLAASARLLLGAGDVATADMSAAVVALGRRFEHARAEFNPDTVDAASSALNDLYALFGAQPALPRQRHDGTSEIAAPVGDDASRFAALWEQLVPPSGHAPTRQGEAVRVAGRLAREILDNGSVNWGRDFRRMADALPSHLAAGVPLEPADLAEASELVRTVRRGAGDDEELHRLMALTAAWVERNPAPLPLGRVPYRF